MGKDKKRKRDPNAEDEAEQRPSKAQFTDNGNQVSGEFKVEKSGGEHRQKKSERRKKSAPQAKQTAPKEKPETKVKASTDEPPIQDSIAGGQDFVPLIEATARKTEKKKSPMSNRKEVRQSNGKGASTGNENANIKASGTVPSARFICFVGNLPYTVTTEQIAAHFSKLQPKSVRLSTDKQTGKCKGFAFLEFDNYDKMKTCLKLYHHSIFDPEPEGTEQADGKAVATNRNVKSKARKINVELTAGGGGGKSEGRRDKIKAKNVKLDEERARDWEKKQLEEAEKSRSRRPRKGAQTASGANTEHPDEPANNNRGDIHPSRLSRVEA